MPKRAFRFCVCYFTPLTSASNSPTLHYMPSCCKLRRFGVVGIGVYHSWRRSWRGRATNARGSSPRPPLCAKIRPTWDTRPYGRPTCQSKKEALDLLAAALSKARHISAATPWSWGVSSRPPPGGSFGPFWNGCLNDPWRQRPLES